MRTKTLAAAAALLTLTLGPAATAEPAPVITQTDRHTLSFLEFAKEQRNAAMMGKTLHALKAQVKRTRYVFAGSNTRGWDCSGLVVWAYRHFGLELPHSATAQARLGDRVITPAPGDIVVFAYPGRTDFYHSAIYIGGGKVINANRLFGTTLIEPLSNFKHSQVRYVRVVKQAKR